jgi:IS30 family transposase
LVLKHHKITAQIKGWIKQLLEQGSSPEQIAGRLKLEDNGKLHHESIYRHIYNDKAQGDSLYKHITRLVRSTRNAMAVMIKEANLLIE